MHIVTRDTALKYMRLENKTATDGELLAQLDGLRERGCGWEVISGLVLSRKQSGVHRKLGLPMYIYFLMAIVEGEEPRLTKEAAKLIARERRPRRRVLEVADVVS
jgi:hypothetical protein